MQNRWISLLLIASVAMNAAFVATVGYGYIRNRNPYAQEASQHFSHDHHYYEVLALTPAQLKKMTPIAALFHAQLDHLHADMEIKKNAMINALRDEKTSDKQVDKLRKEMAVIQDRIQKKVIAHIMEVKAILNPRQQERFFELLHESMSEERPMFTPAGAK